jgi:hypothetical protein
MESVAKIRGTSVPQLYKLRKNGYFSTFSGRRPVAVIIWLTDFVQGERE